MMDWRQTEVENRRNRDSNKPESNPPLQVATESAVALSLLPFSFVIFLMGV